MRAPLRKHVGLTWVNWVVISRWLREKWGNCRGLYWGNIWKLVIVLASFWMIIPTRPVSFGKSFQFFRCAKNWARRPGGDKDKKGREREIQQVRRRQEEKKKGRKKAKRRRDSLLSVCQPVARTLLVYRLQSLIQEHESSHYCISYSHSQEICECWLQGGLYRFQSRHSTTTRDKQWSSTRVFEYYWAWAYL